MFRAGFRTTGAIGGRWRSIMIRSASLPSSSEPTLSPMPSTLAPSIVAIRRTCQAGRAVGSLGLDFGEHRGSAHLGKDVVRVVARRLIGSETHNTTQLPNRRAGGTTPSMIPIEFVQQAMRTPRDAASSNLIIDRHTHVDRDRVGASKPIESRYGIARSPERSSGGVVFARDPARHADE